MSEGTTAPTPASGGPLGIGLPLGVTLGGASTTTGTASPASTLLGVTLGGSTGSGATTPPLIAVGVSLGGTPGSTGSTAATPPLVGVDLSLGGASGSAGATTAPPPVIGVVVAVGGAPGATGSTGSTGLGVGVNGGLALGSVSIGVGASAGTSPGTGTSTSPGPGGGGTGGGGAGGTGSTGGGAASTAMPDPHTAFINIFRLGGASEIPANINTQLNALDTQIASGAITAKQAVLQIVNAAAGFTAVAETTYQFFTGLTPTANGLNYLVHSAGNPADLSDGYYDRFNLENRYINFASNLGLHSDFAPEFARVFGAMSFNDAVATAYERIVGSTAAAAAGVNATAAIADIAGRRPYFEAVAHERFAGDDFGLSTKLAAIAYIMEEAVRANVGAYGEANQNFLFDLADGSAQFNVNLVGVYGHGTPLDVV